MITKATITYDDGTVVDFAATPTALDLSTIPVLSPAQSDAAKTAIAPASTDTSTDTDATPAPQQGDACTMPDGVTAGTLQPGGNGLVCVAN